MPSGILAALPDPVDYGWWLASRAAGIVAILAASASVVAGLLMANGLPRGPGVKRRLLDVHEATALVALGAIALHGAALLFDGYLQPAATQLLVPFTLDYRPGWTGLGIIAGYLAAALGLSYYARRAIGPALWRRVHRATILVWVLGVLHVLGAGTDAGALWLRALLAATALPITFLLVLRLLPAPSPARLAQPPASASAPAASAPAREPLW